MFVIDLEYTASLDVIDQLLPDHQAHLRQGHVDGVFLSWGRKQPRTGGVILAVGAREEVERRAMEDPFVREGACTVTVTEMIPTFTAPGLEALAA
ncbi:MAG: YciI family protein [Pseudomonadota bacterium]